MGCWLGVFAETTAARQLSAVTTKRRNGGFAARMGRLGELSLQWVSRGAIAQSRVEGKLGTGAIQA